MKIVLLAGASSIHAIRWANGLSAAGHELHLITQHTPCEPLSNAVTVHLFPYRGMMGYFSIIPSVKKLLKDIRPDIVNAHYASGYATTARLVNYRPWLLSTWGSDVYDFPYKTPIHKWLIRANLLAANSVASTSHCMAQQICELAPLSIGDIHITPFGVDIPIFKNQTPNNFQNGPNITIGTIKTLAPNYGIDTLVESFVILLSQIGKSDSQLASKLRLRIVGGGPQREQLERQTVKLGIDHLVTFTGRVAHQQVPSELAKLDIYVALSRAESFGVAIIEAGASGRPVVVSDAGGLPEVVIHEVTGLVVPKESPSSAASAIEKLVLEPNLRRQMGLKAQKHVEEYYSWPACVERMLKAFDQTIENYKHDK